MANVVFGTTPGNFSDATKWVGGVAPTTSDSAVFMATSAACTIPAATTVVCGAIDFTGLGASSYTAAFTFAATTSVLTVGGASLGAVTFVATMTLVLTGIGTINLVATTASTTYQFTSAGLVMPNLTVHVGATTTIQFDAVTMGTTTTVTQTQGGLSTNNAAQSWGLFSSNNSNTRVLTLGSSAVALTGTGTVWNTASITGLTVTANTATVTANGAGVTFSSGGVNLNGGSWSLTGSGTATVSGAFTVANFTRAGTAVKTDTLSISNGFTVTGALAFTGNSLVNRLLVQSSAVGTQRTIALGATGTSSTSANVDFMDAAITGTNSPLTGTSLGDAQGNGSGITFTPAVTRYGVVAGNGSSTATWSTTSGGAGGASVPLPQDTMVLDANSAAGTYTMDMPRLGVSLTCTGFTRTLALTSVANTLFGSLTLASGMTMTSTQNMTLAGRSSSTVTNAGFTFGAVLVIAPTGTVTLNDAMAMTNALTMTIGTFTANGFNVSVSNFLINGGTLNMGSGTWASTFAGGTTVWSVTGAPVVNASTSTIAITSASAGSHLFSGGGKTYGTLTYTVANSPGPLVISNNGGTIGTLNVGPGRVWTQQVGTTCTFGTINASGVSNGYFQVPGVAAAYASTPDASALDITGNITVEAQMSLPVWTTGTYYPESKWTGTAATSAYRLSLVAGKIVLDISAGGSIVTATSTVNVALSAGIGWIAAQRVQSTGVVTFSTSPDGATWTPIGSTVTLASGTAINNAAQILEFGTFNTGASVSTAFALYRCRIWSDVTRTTLALDANFATKPACATTFTESSTNAATVTINGAMAQAGDGSIVLNSSTSDTQATMSSASNQTANYLIYQDSKVQGGGIWTSGPFYNSVSNNTGWNILYARAVAAAVTTSVAAVKAAGARKAASVATSITTGRTGALIRALTVSTSVAFLRSIGASKSASVNTSTTAPRSVQTARNATVTATAALARAVASAKTAGVSTGASAQRAVRANRTATVVTSATASRAWAMARTAVVSTSAGFVRTVTAIKTAVVGVAATAAIPTRIYLRTVNVVVSTSAAVTRRLSTSRQATVTTSVSGTKLVRVAKAATVATGTAFRRVIGAIKSTFVGTTTTPTLKPTRYSGPPTTIVKGTGQTGTVVATVRASNVVA